MTESRDSERLERQAKALFDDSVERLDGATLSRLNQGRQKALEELHKPGVGNWGRWAPVTGVAAAAAIAVMVMNGTTVDVPVDDPVTVSDFEMLLETDSLEMLEDLEFFSLLDAVDTESNGHVG
ncbi:MAG: hypothetical protein GTO71_05530 [Woeseiaceae bacterium]|nr:hypothetical protein [Woeseiaceae bacterium]NIP20559.1 hypothetical protein [Woeseiaceae bacterium]NIS89352.1 hypothetical protein [Woeseiaceae bacterium]